ncbi:MAG: response regulator [Calditrichaceae bacterium]
MGKVKKILLVEDDKNDLELTLSALDENHLSNEIDIVRDGEEALDYLYRRGRFKDRDKENPAVILLDLKLPKVNGMEVLKQVKGDPDLKSIPIVMLTSSREEKDLVSSYNLGVNAFVVKPVEFERFVDAVKQLGLFWAVLNEAPSAKL